MINELPSLGHRATEKNGMIARAKRTSVHRRRRAFTRMRLSFGRRDPEFVAVRNDENRFNRLLALLRRDEYGQSAKSDRYA